ncbi:hypothetical protein AA106555_0608 [Neokomagataea thailandica NBRC 106555]|uniref:Uncharacterized protein n=1 Tax=Neokomagataea thailandica NBRC 106555 TaxID=1223520 RepID=A0ABQ0QNL1_9PROT|nr:hypothetical protein AA106555_0608 [Neokomagataea thailandica NBRC 106555]
MCHGGLDALLRRVVGRFRGVVLVCHVTTFFSVGRADTRPRSPQGHNADSSEGKREAFKEGLQLALMSLKCLYVSLK